MTANTMTARTTQLVHFARLRDRLSIVATSYQRRPVWLVQAIWHYQVARSRPLCSASSSDLQVVAGLALFPQGAMDPTPGVGAFPCQGSTLPGGGCGGGRGIRAKRLLQELTERRTMTLLA